MDSRKESSSLSRATLGAELLNTHNHVRPETADAAVMVKAASKKLGQRPISAEASGNTTTSAAYQKSVEEELELTSRISSKTQANESQKGQCKKRQIAQHSSVPKTTLVTC